MKKTHLILAFFLSGMTICVSGCILIAVGAGAAGTVAYVKGELETTLSANMDKSYEATLSALDQLKIVPVQKQKDALTAEVIARTSTDDKVTIKLKRVDDKLTSLSIRIGIFGDQVMSTTIYERVKQNLNLK
jgi:hypothetical protein